MNVLVIGGACIAAAVALAVIVCSAGAGIEKLVEKLRGEGNWPIRDSVQFAGYVVMAKKRHTCPYIEFADKEQVVEQEPVFELSFSPETVARLEHEARAASA